MSWLALQQTMSNESLARTPQLLYARNFKLWYKDSPRISFLRRANVVLHAVSTYTPRTLHASAMCGRPLNENLANGKQAQILATRDPKSPFSHKRYTLKKHGKILIFRTGNIIRAGKHTHGDAVTALYAFTRWASRGTSSSLSWPTTVSVPNTVCNAAFTKRIDLSVRSHFRATYTNKFPGIALCWKALKGVTIELFLKRNNWIAPGIATPQMLARAAKLMNDLHEEVEINANVPAPPPDIIEKPELERPREIDL